MTHKLVITNLHIAYHVIAFVTTAILTEKIAVFTYIYEYIAGNK